MTRYLKRICTVLGAVVALSAFFASAALATNHFGGIGEGEEENPGGVITLKNSGAEDTFQFDIGKVVCKKTAGEGTVIFPVQEITFDKLSFTECTGPKGEKITIDMNGCDNEYKIIGFNGTSWEGQLDIICPATKQIEFTLPGCTITVHEQFGKQKVLYHNEGTGVKAETSTEVGVTGIEYVEDNAGVLKNCTHPGAATNNGTYTGQEKFTNETKAGAMRGLVISQ